MFPVFPSVPAELQQKVLQKLSAQSYSKFRRTGQHASQLVEYSRRYLSIHPREKCRIYLLDSYRNMISFGELYNKGPDIRGIHVLIDYGAMKWDASLKLPMIKENIPVLKKAIEGFHFYDIVVSNLKHCHVDSDRHTFNDAFLCFMAAIEDIRTDPRLSVRNLSDMQVSILTAVVKPVSLTLFNDTLDMKHMELTKKATETLFLHWKYIKEGVNIYEMTTNKRRVILDSYQIENTPIMWRTMEQMIKDWKQYCAKWNETRFFFIENRSFSLLDISEEDTVFSRQGGFHLGTFAEKDAAVYSHGLNGERSTKYDLFMIPGPEKTLCVSMETTKFSIGVDVFMTDLSQEKMDPSEFWALHISYLFANAAVDASLLFEKLRDKPLMEIKKEIWAFHGYLVRRYKKPLLKRPLPSVIHEVVTEPWNWTKWTLELNRRKMMDPYKRSQLKDLGRIIWEEYLSPFNRFVSIL